ncbi:hypothetical protein L2K20_19555 [Mycobacterium sp. MBM]|nr:hypothetical protein [Mycobacterium sp. MBM]
MLIIALVLAVIGLTALVAAVVTSNELVAWVCIGASVIGVLLLIADALRSRRAGDDDADDAADADADDGEDEQGVQDYPDEPESLPIDPGPTAPEPTESEPVESEPVESEPVESEPQSDVAGVTDAEDESEPGGAVQISPDPEQTPER